MSDFPIKSKPAGNARILVSLLDKHGQDKICDCLAIIGWALDKAREQERERADNLITQRMREIANEPLAERKNAFEELGNMRKNIN